jgi:chemotaxis protein CheD
MFLREIDRTGADPSEYEAKVFGGGDQFTGEGHAATIDVPARNVDAGLRLLSEHNLHPVSQHVGGSGPRVVILDLDSGHVWVRHRKLLGREHAR